MLGIYRAVLPPSAWIEFDPGAPLVFSVWMADDIIGSGETAREAVAEARKQIRTWRWRALDEAQRRAWRMADKAGAPFGAGAHGIALTRVAGCCTAMCRMTKVAGPLAII